jgi:hypothetical protein
MGQDGPSRHDYKCLSLHHQLRNYQCNRICLDLPAHIYMDNPVTLAIDRAHMEMVLATAIEAIFVVMGETKISVRQCLLAMDKWSELVIGPKQNMLGLIIDTNKLTILFHTNVSNRY